ncbi:HD domain-containing protein [uncultured Sunxiuqinia sp.]|uniref:HD domain-containing protein n=1 Tax=uncultured Sunxiuqinia sp. TaxID=1573825 RepID=UPI002AA66FB3|nr:HD domain-containing protein [uncultured Sunxiuqinia sp.]
MEELSVVKENIQAARNFFEKYTAVFLKQSDPKMAEVLALKREHSLQVSKISGVVATNLMLEEEDILLAEIIGLLHDVGRFEQFVQYQSFNDEQSENHAQLGVNILREQTFFKNLTEVKKNLITQVILNHNKEGISLKEDKMIVTYSQILRDADKLDIWETCVKNLNRDGSFKLDAISHGLPAAGTVSDNIVKSIKSHKPAKRKDMESVNDYKLAIMSMIFDLNFRVSFQLLNEKQLIKKLYESMSKKDVVIDAYRELRLYIENKFIV